MFKLRRVSFLILAVMLISATSHANMKKGQVASKGTKTFSFSTSLDGPCTSSVIYDSTTADLDTGFIFPDTGDILCYSVSGQRNFDSCTVGLPPGDYEVFVTSYKGSSAFRLVVTCGGQETVNAAGQRVVETELREVEPNANARKVQDKIERIGATVKQ